MSVLESTPVAPPSLPEIEAAARGLASVCLHTPLVPYRGSPAAPELLLKPETLQPVSSFKLRGVYHAVASLSPTERAAGVSTVSAGNTAQALGWAARHFGVGARSLMPESAPATKIEAVRALGATPVLVPVGELFAYLREHRWQDEPWSFIHPWTDRQVMTGHASLGLEIQRDLPEVDTVFIPVGGGGLLAGAATALKLLKAEVRVVAVEPAGCPALHTALEAGEPVEVPCRTLCDGVAVPYITAEMFPLLQSLVDEVVLVSEEAVRRSIAELALAHKLIVEGSGALSLAAALATPAERRGTSVALVTGGSLAPELLIEVLQEARKIGIEA